MCIVLAEGDLGSEEAGIVVLFVCLFFFLADERTCKSVSNYTPVSWAAASHSNPSASPVF